MLSNFTCVEVTPQECLAAGNRVGWNVDPATCAAGSVDTDSDGIIDVCEQCASDADCDDGLFCNGQETCQAGVCISGENPCPAADGGCDEETDSCQSCVFDLDQTGVIGGGDFGLFSGCFGRCYQPLDPEYETCLPMNFDGVIDEGSGEYCVGGGDFGVFSGCFAKTCEQCDTCFGSGSGGGERSID